MTIRLRDAIKSTTPIYVAERQESIEERRYRQCPTILSRYNQGAICGACEDRRARFLARYAEERA